MAFPYSKLIIFFCTGVVVCASSLGVFRSVSRPAALAVSDVPITFWSWRMRAPTEAELEEAFVPTRARKLFLRAGQFDSGDGRVERIRPVSGTLPTSVELHFVYNGTRDLLRDFEGLDVSLVANTIADVYRTDLARANHDVANVGGVQLDLDIPVRLLPRYAELLRALRTALPADTKLSITGLPAWTISDDLAPVLEAVDFWIPQFYGGEVPGHASQRIPISSRAEVTRYVERVRQLSKPFYAGLATYSYAILYDKKGSLLELRGNIDPAIAAVHADLALVDRVRFDGDDSASNLRYEYLARNDLVIDGLNMRAGESLVFDVPSAEGLRAAARVVRENGGPSLLGICLFRLPTADDDTSLSASEITAALNDVETKVSTAITVELPRSGGLILTAANNGTASSIAGDGAMAIDLEVPSGSVRRVTLRSGFRSYETLCMTPNEPRPCGANRANVIRLRTQFWRPGVNASAAFDLTMQSPPTLHAVVTTHVDDGRVVTEPIEINTSENRNDQ